MNYIDRGERGEVKVTLLNPLRIAQALGDPGDLVAGVALLGRRRGSGRS